MTNLRNVLQRPLVLAGLVALLALLLYLRTAAPTVLPGDSGELQFAAWGFWLAHPTGYPLYLILGGIWQHLVPFGDPAYRLNIFSALCTALALVFVFLICFELTRGRIASLLATLALMVTPLVWSQATRAEVYALNTLFVAALVWLAVLWRKQGDFRWGVAFALVFGLSLTHHRTTVLLIPAFVALFAEPLIALRPRWRTHQREAMILLACVLAPLILYAFIPLRAGATPYASLDVSPAAPIVVYENSVRGWLTVPLGTGFAGALSADSNALATVMQLPSFFIAQFNLVGVAIGLVGLSALVWARQWALLAMLTFGIISFGLFTAVYQIGDIADLTTPALVFFSFALALGIDAIARVLTTPRFGRATILPNLALLAILVFVPLQNLFANFPTQNLSQRFETRALWLDRLGQDLPQDAILLSNDRDEMTPLYYLKYVEEVRPDVVGVFPRIATGAAYDNVISLVARIAPSARPIFAIKDIPALRLRYRVEDAADSLVRIYPRSPRNPEYRSGVMLGDVLGVRGFTLLSGEPFAGEELNLAVQYNPVRRLTSDFKTSLQLWDGEGNKIAQGNDHVPGEGEYPPTRWKPGETLQDEFVMPLPENLAGGTYRLMLNAYEPGSGDTLGDFVQIGEIPVEE